MFVLRNESVYTCWKQQSANALVCNDPPTSSVRILPCLLVKDTRRKDFFFTFESNGFVPADCSSTCIISSLSYHLGLLYTNAPSVVHIVDQAKSGLIFSRKMLLQWRHYKVI